MVNNFQASVEIRKDVLFTVVGKKGEGFQCGNLNIYEAHGHCVIIGGFSFFYSE